MRNSVIPWPNLSILTRIRALERISRRPSIHLAMSVDFQGVTQIQLVDGFTVSVIGLYARWLAQSATAGCD